MIFYFSYDKLWLLDLKNDNWNWQTSCVVLGMTSVSVDMSFISVFWVLCCPFYLLFQFSLLFSFAPHQPDFPSTPVWCLLYYPRPEHLFSLLSLLTCTAPPSWAFPSFECLSGFTRLSSLFLVFFGSFPSPVFVHLAPPAPHHRLVSLVYIQGQWLSVCLFGFTSFTAPVSSPCCVILVFAPLVSPGLSPYVLVCTFVFLVWALFGFCGSFFVFCTFCIWSQISLKPTF